MIDYSVLEIGLACCDNDNYRFCYEAVRDDFFEEISGPSEYIYVESVDSLKRYASAAKSWISENKKKLAFLAAGCLIIGAAVVKIRKEGRKKDAELLEKNLSSIREKYNDLRTRYDETVKKHKQLMTESDNLFKQSQHLSLLDEDTRHLRDAELKKYYQKRENIKKNDNISDRLKRKATKYYAKRYNDAKKAEKTERESIRKQKAQNEIDMDKVQIEIQDTELAMKSLVKQMSSWTKYYNTVLSQYESVCDKFKIKAKKIPKGTTKKELVVKS